MRGFPVPQLEGYVARDVQPVNATKDYVCPECGNPIPAGEGHVVVWPLEGSEDRRHWHRHCWRLAAGRGRIA